MHKTLCICKCSETDKYKYGKKHTSSSCLSSDSTFSFSRRTSPSRVRSSSFRLEPSLSKWCAWVSNFSAVWLSDRYCSNMSARSRSWCTLPC